MSNDNVVPVMDPVAAAYRKVRDATACNQDISVATSVGILEQVKFEILRNAQQRIDEAGA